MPEKPSTTRRTMIGMVVVLLILIAVYFMVPILGTAGA